MKYSPYPYRPPNRPEHPEGCNCDRCRPDDCCDKNCRPQNCRPQDCRPQDCRPQSCQPQDCRPQDCQPQACRPQDCRPQDCRPSAQALLPKILCSGREWCRNLSACLAVEGLPACAEPPFTLLSVTQSCAAPWWEPTQRKVGRRQVCYRIFIPVSCQVEDCNGCMFTGAAVVEIEAMMNLNCPREECWRHCLMILPCVRMACAPVCSKDASFDVRLEVLVEMYLVRWEPCTSGTRKPACPDLPLFPQPWPL